MKGIASRIGTALIISAMLFFSLKSCVVTVWKSPDSPTTYSIYGPDGRSLAMIFLPKNETIILYTENESEFMEGALTKMRGVYGTHYLWRLWKVEGPGTGEGLFGYRIYPDGAEPVAMEISILKKFIHGSSESAMGDEGDRTHEVILFTNNAVRFSDMWLEKESTDPELVQALMSMLKP